jgi:hypothetical protein
MAVTTVPLCSSPDQRPVLSSYQHRRRDLLSGLAGAAVAGTAVVAPVFAEAATDPHVEWHREWRALCDWWNNSPGDESKDSGDHPVWARMVVLQDLIADTPAETVPGMLAQVDVALVFLGVEDPSHSWASMEERVLKQLRASLTARAAA